MGGEGAAPDCDGVKWAWFAPGRGGRGGAGRGGCGLRPDSAGNGRQTQRIHNPQLNRTDQDLRP